MTPQQLELLFDYIESRVQHLSRLTGTLPCGVAVALSEREKEIREQLTREINGNV